MFPGALVEAEETIRVASVQNRYNLIDRASQDVLDYCEQRRIAFIPWLPVAPTTRASTTDDTGTIAKRHGATRAQVALAWLLQRSPVMLPIPGTSSRAHLEENVAAASMTLSKDDAATLMLLAGR